jgi:hypothetical protein
LKGYGPLDLDVAAQIDQDDLERKFSIKDLEKKLDASIFV